ncbi:trimeric intracellular cation channel family protein [Fulvimarina sp. 2208YS6-2-32]|uniref:Trimeric intracellular cation channel family protein n=1 Tax=Fulvimarina uroteuthidis TaxID=3098149 RepID=A0ABU5I0W0_9HYPH|nr:trimeric intracellular cation channel family protein [Fulvimarina sp. 2208YS6-2-32]MDY8108982.1 trimeric intracellular cation channel family protein [Fulvimarina sp. 2208YS6-2-32]
MTLPSLALTLDLLGTFVFALSGGMLAVRRSLDVFGIMVLAVSAGLAGGLARDALLGAHPPAALADSRYLTAALLAGLAAFFGHRLIERMTKPVMVLDALGLGFFAVAGCQKALLYGLSPLPAMILGVLTAVGGGVVRDLLVTEIPRVLREEVYALAALIGAGIVVLGEHFSIPDALTVTVAIAVTFAVRVLSVWRNWQAPRAPGT